MRRIAAVLDPNAAERAIEIHRAPAAMIRRLSEARPGATGFTSAGTVVTNETAR
jgi:hypothetical protein